MKIDRRGFLMATTLGAAAAALPAMRTAQAADRPGEGEAAASPRRLIVNALGGLDDPNLESDSLVPRLTPRVLAEAHASGLSVVNVTLGYIAGDADPFEASVRDIAATDALLRAHEGDVRKVLTAADIERSRDDGRIGLLYGFQNGAMLGDDVARVDVFANLGVRVFQLTYNPANRLGDGSMAPENRGLTPFGREAIARINAARCMVDLSHSGEQTCLEAARVSSAPISINHTGCRALVDLPRNKTDAELRLVAERGGFVGIYFMPFLAASGQAHAADVVAHIEHAIDVCGEDHVGIGTDGPISAVQLTDDYKKAFADEIAERRKAGVSAPGETTAVYTFVPDLNTPRRLETLAVLLARRGHPERVIEKVLGGNFLRLFDETWPAA
jgi:membrane dipeptidase